MPDDHGQREAYATVSFAGERLLLSACGLLVWPDRALVAVADLHFEKGSHFARLSGQMLPPYDTDHTLDRLTRALDTVAADHGPVHTLILVGDTLHDADALAHLSPQSRQMFDRLMTAYDLVWIRGNHDGEAHPDGLHAVTDLKAGALTFRHEASHRGGGEISGHYHPKIRLTLGGQRLWRPTFVVSHTHLILPAFGSFAGGLDVFDPALKPYWDPQSAFYICGRTRLVRCPAQRVL